MPRTFYERTFITGTAYNLADKQSLNILRPQNVLHSVTISVRGKMTLATGSGTLADNKLQPGGIYNILKRVIFRWGGYDPAVGMRLPAERRVDIDGKYFGWGGNPAGSPAAVANLTDENAYPRMSFLTPHELRIPQQHFVDPDPNATTEQEFFAEFEIPFYLSNGIAPSDLWLDMSFANLAQIQVETADNVNSIFTESGITMSLSDAIIEIHANKIERLDTLTAKGGAHDSAGYCRWQQQRIEVNADNPNRRKDFDLSDNLVADYYVGLKPNSTTPADVTGYLPDDAIIQGIRLENNNNAFYEMSNPNIWRAENGRNFGHPAMEASGGAMAGFLYGSGCYVAAPCMTTLLERIYLSKSVYVGKINKSMLRILNLKKPSDRNGVVDIISWEYIPNDKFAALSRPQNVLGDTRRAQAAIDDAETTKIAAQQEADAQSLGAV